MKRIVSFLTMFMLLVAMAFPVSAVKTVQEVEKVHFSFETEEELSKLTMWSVIGTQADGGVHGTEKTFSVTTQSAAGGVRWNQYLEPGSLYNASVWIKPVEGEVESVRLIIITATEDADGNTGDGWEEIPLMAGETTADGYVRYFVDNYRVSDRAYPGNNQTPMLKQEGAVSRTCIRVPKANVTYLMDEVVLEPVEGVICYEDFDTKVNSIAPIYESYNASNDAIRSETFTASLIPHQQTKYVTGADGYANIAGSQLKGVFFEHVTLEPAKVYRLSADITGGSTNSESTTEASVGGFVKMANTENEAILSNGTLEAKQKTTIPQGEETHVEYIFRTGYSSAATYVEDGITIERIGFYTKGTYCIWQADNMKLEEIKEIPYGGDMEDLIKLTDNCEKNTGVYKDVYAGTKATQLFACGDSNTTLTPVSSDGEHGDYLNVSFAGGTSAELGNTRRLAFMLNLEKGKSYRLTYRAKLSPDETHPLGTAKFTGMYNLGKVDANGLVYGEEGYNASTASYGYIHWTDGALTTEWKTFETTFRVQNRAQTGHLYLGIDEFHPLEGAIVSIDDITLENMTDSITNATLANDNGIFTASVQKGSGVGTISYELYTSDNGVSFARADISDTGVFPMKPTYAGKYVKAKITGITEEGKTIAAETNTLRNEGYTVSLQDDVYTLRFSASHWSEDDSDKVFTAIVAQYDAQNRMISFKATGSVGSTAEFSVDKETTAVSAKSFVWENLTSLKPVYTSGTLAVNQPGPSLKILGIGNSYTMDSMEYYYQIAKDAGAEELTLAYLYYGGSSLKNHVEFAETESASYTFYRNETGTWKNTKEQTFLDGLTAEDWDIIVIQQQSKNAAVASSFAPHLNQLISLINENKTNPNAKIYWNMTWAYEEGYSDLGIFGTQANMYNCIVDNVQNIIEPNKDIAEIIPVGTAVQNARYVLGDTLNRDGTHLSLDTGRYLAALTWVKKTLGLSIDNVTYIPSGHESVLTENVIHTLKKAANDAVKNPCGVTK